MKVEKAYILKIDRPNSIEYAQTASDSCNRIGLPYELFDGYDHKKISQSVWDIIRPHVKVKTHNKGKDGGSCATAGHFMIWKKILDNKECAIVLEHDGVMLHPLELDIPDGNIVVLGYKCKDPWNYDHEKAGPPIKLEDRKKHGGAHAYALTYRTTEMLLDVLENGNKSISLIDNAYFFSDKLRGAVKMKISEPTCAIGWLRDSTIWARSAVDNYGPILPSFLENYHSKNSLEIK